MARFSLIASLIFVSFRAAAEVPCRTRFEAAATVSEARVPRFARRFNSMVLQVHDVVTSGELRAGLRAAIDDPLVRRRLGEIRRLLDHAWPGWDDDDALTLIPLRTPLRLIARGAIRRAQPRRFKPELVNSIKEV